MARPSPRSLVLAVLAFSLLLGGPSTPLGLAAPATPDPCATLPTPSSIPTSADPVWHLDGHREVDAMAPTVGSIIRDARVSYMGPHGSIEGFVAGETYRNWGGSNPALIFARDTATILPMSRYYFGQSTFRSPVDEFLRLQYTDSTVSADGDLGQPVGAGALSGTISADFKVDKATATSDEEASVILAAALAFNTVGDEAWLGREIDGRTVLERLNTAMDWLLTHRLDAQAGLIRRGHTTDWGDVKQELAPNPNDVGEWHVWTYSIYDQAIVVAALRDLVEMNAAAGQQDTARRYLVQAESIRANTDRLLWMPERGYYRLHLHAFDSPAPHPFDEDAMIAIGNAATLYYGLAGGDKAGPIVRSLEAARVHAGAYKPGLTLDPPYPSGAFLQIQMDVRNYQNGALWDWWGGRQVTAEYRSGYSAYGDAHLIQMAEDWSHHPGLVYEWESPWTGKASKDDHYTGGAAVVGEAVVNGLFGVSLSRYALELAPRLATRNGSITLNDAATGAGVAYVYDYAADGQATLCYQTSFGGAITLRPLVPVGMRVVSASLDSAPVTFAEEAVNDDRYVRVIGQSGTHRLHLLLLPQA